MSNYKVIAEAIASGKLKDVDLSTDRVNNRRMTVDEIKKHVSEEFEKAKAASDVEAEELAWGDSEIAKEIDWVKALDLCEFFNLKGK